MVLRDGEKNRSVLVWANGVLGTEGLGDWEIKWKVGPTVDGYTWFDTKTIDVRWPETDPMPALILHEIAHVKIGKGRHDYHDSMFAHEFMRLVNQWMIPVNNQ